MSSSPIVRRKPSPRARSSTSAGPPGSWNSVKGARANAVILSFEISRDSLWVAMPFSTMSRVSMRSGSLRPPRFAPTRPAAIAALNSAVSPAYEPNGGRSLGAA